MARQKFLSPIEQVQHLLEQNNSFELTGFIGSLPSKEVIHLVGHLSRQDKVKLFSLLSPEVAAEMIEDIPDIQAAEIIEDLDIIKAAAILDNMTSDEQADLIQEMDVKDAEAILLEMTPEEAVDVRNRLHYDPETAGGIMITEYLVLDESITVQEAIRQLRKNAESFQSFEVQYIYVNKPDESFSGVLQMRDLLITSKNTRLSAIVIRDVLTFRLDHTLDDMSNFFDTYDFFGVPVIDEKAKLVGLVLRKDVLEAVTEKLTYEHLETQGIIGGDEIRTMPVLFRSRRRLSWLSVNILLNIIAASVIAYHQDVLSSVIAMAVFLPIISDMSGCSGNQAVAVSIRELSIGVVKPNESFRVWVQEISVGLINGLILGILLGIAAFLWKGNVYLGIVAGGALALNTLVAVSIGGTIPLLLKKYGVDPALASGPVLTTITDMFGFFMALTFASMMLPYLTGM